MARLGVCCLDNSLCNRLRRQSNMGHSYRSSLGQQDYGGGTVAVLYQPTLSILGF